MILSNDSCKLAYNNLNVQAVYSDSSGIARELSRKYLEAMAEAYYNSLDSQEANIFLWDWQPEEKLGIFKKAMVESEQSLFIYDAGYVAGVKHGAGHDVSHDVSHDGGHDAKAGVVPVAAMWCGAFTPEYAPGLRLRNKTGSLHFTCKRNMNFNVLAMYGKEFVNDCWASSCFTALTCVIPRHWHGARRLAEACGFANKIILPGICFIRHRGKLEDGCIYVLERKDI